ncbi:MAG TPA: tRNA (adenosine(37)-N6)-dimethylallyltransferase MiaA [Alphaproteobacteria bacterium]|nr:tRNA (adenosine(37)-N6)-dimethylallyltransferase MiaA [Alphaproteobacteria bacterium]
MPTYFLVGGPTAGGKSDYALSLAKKIDGEIINADSVQVYNALKILTAQPNDFEGIPHHLYGRLPPYDSLNAASWSNMAVALIKDCWSRHKVPIIVGGTGLYLQILTSGLSPIPQVFPEIRQEVLAIQKSLSKEDFYAFLKKQDPLAASRLHPHDSQRLSRALEVMLQTKVSIVTWQKKSLPLLSEPYEYHVILPKMEELEEKIHKRFIQMLDLGVVQEVENFLNLYELSALSPTLQKTVGLREIELYLKGDYSKQEMISQVILKTRQYAKRQITWFKKILEQKTTCQEK